MVHKIKVNGKKYPFKLGIKAFRDFAITYQGSTEKLDLSKLDEFKLIYLGFKYGAEREGLDFNLSENDLEDLFDDDFQAYLEAVNIMAASLPKQEKNGKAPKGKKKRAV